MNKVNNFFTDYVGEDWKDLFLQAAMIGFGLGITIALVTITVCQSL